jgi:methyl-accepting chemotaxis protein
MMHEPLTKERLVSDWYRTIHTSVRRTTAIAKSADPSLASFFAADAAEASRMSTEQQKAIEALIESPEEKAVFAKLGEVRKDYIKHRDAISKAKADGNAEEAAKILAGPLTWQPRATWICCSSCSTCSAPILTRWRCISRRSIARAATS